MEAGVVFEQFSGKRVIGQMGLSDYIQNNTIFLRY